MMKITKQLPQFEGETVLLIVTGKQEADFYKVSDGVAEKIDSFKIEKPVYSDREGHFKTRRKGKTYASGAVYEPLKEKMLDYFIKELKRKLPPTIQNIEPDRVYIYTPAYMVNMVRSTFSKRTAPLIKRVFRGNYYNRHHVFDLLAKIRTPRQKN